MSWSVALLFFPILTIIVPYLCGQLTLQRVQIGIQYLQQFWIEQKSSFYFVPLSFIILPKHITELIAKD